MMKPEDRNEDITEIIKPLTDHKSMTEVTLIWIKKRDGQIWLHGAWDALSIANNADAFQARLQELDESLIGTSKVVRLQKVSVPQGSVVALFDVPIIVMDLDQYPRSSIAHNTHSGETLVREMRLKIWRLQRAVLAGKQIISTAPAPHTMTPEAGLAFGLFVSECIKHGDLKDD